MGWQRELVAELTPAAGMQQLWLLGSTATGAYDRWSDVDLGLVLDADLDCASLLPTWRDTWAAEANADDDGQVVRAVLPDGRRVDVVVAAPTAFADRADARNLWSNGDRHRPTARLRLAGQPPPDVNEIRFLLMAAAVKFGRGDRLIGGHLALAAARCCLVQGMLLRDADEGTTIHRHGTRRDEAAADVWRALGTDPGPDSLIRLAEVFDRLHQELDPAYVPDWSPLIGLV